MFTKALYPKGGGTQRAMIEQDCVSLRWVKNEVNLFVMALKDAHDI